MTGAVVCRWEASARRADFAGWVETFRTRAMEGMLAVEGILSIRFLAAREEDPCRVTVLTTWNDMDAVERFAGDAPERTVMPDGTARFFTEHDDRARFHDETLVEDAR